MAEEELAERASQILAGVSVLSTTLYRRMRIKLKTQSWKLPSAIVRDYKEVTRIT